MAVYSRFIRFLWGDQADWLLHIRTSDNAAALWATCKHYPMLEVMQSCATAVGSWEILFSGNLNAFPPLQGEMGAHLWVMVTAGQQGHGSTIPWLSEGKHLWPEGG